MFTNEEVELAIKNCKWRTDLEGVDICAGMCGPCVRVIDNGDCDVLKQLFSSKANSKKEVKENIDG